MRTILVALMTAALAGGQFGCSDSGQKEAAKDLHGQTMVALREYRSAIAEMSRAAEIDAEGAPVMTPANADQLARLEAAEDTITQALQANADATARSLGMAQMVKAQILLSTGDYHTAVARYYAGELTPSAAQAGRLLARLQMNLARTQILSDLVEPGFDSVEEMIEQTRQRQENLAGRLEQLRQRETELQQAVARIAEDNERLMEQAVELRSQVPTVSLQQGEQLLRQAAEIESEIIASDQQALESEFQLQQVRGQIEMLSAEIAAIESILEGSNGDDDVAGLSDLMERIDEDRQSNRVQLEAMRTWVASNREDVADAAQDVAEQYLAMHDAATAAMDAYEAAAQANRQAVSQLNQARRAAAGEQADYQESGFEPLLDILGSENNLVGAQAQTAQIALGGAVVRHQMLISARQVQRLVSAFESNQLNVDVEMPAELAAAGATVSGEQINQMLETSQQLCQDAAKAYNDAAGSVSREPVDASQTRWLYQMGEAVAMTRAYLITDDEQFRQQALDLTSQIISDNEENELIGPVYQLEAFLTEAG